MRRSGFLQRRSNLTYADRAVVVYAGLLGTKELVIGGVREPAAGNGRVVESDGANSTGGVGLGADGRARRVVAK